LSLTNVVARTLHLIFGTIRKVIGSRPYVLIEFFGVPNPSSCTRPCCLLSL
jgi:hypothetical protein